MRPRRLEIQAFGPFAGSEVVDFDRLAEAGLFLIHGETGAGKTSLIDAMCYALFGSVPGARTSDDLRSDHTSDRGGTSVSFEFSLASADFRVTRTPPQRRPKKRGVGLTTQKPKAVLLRRHGDEWVPMAEGVEDVGEAMHDLLGLTAAQFQQVVVLPQGEFQHALRADAKERGALLSSLFQTGRFASYTERLVERARGLEADAALLQSRLDGVRNQATEHTAGVVDPRPDPQPGETNLAWVAARLSEAAALAAGIRHQDSNAADAAREAHRVGSIEASRWERKRRAVAALVASEADEGRIGDLAAELDRAERSTSLGHVLEALQSAEQTLNAAIDSRMTSHDPVVDAARVALAHPALAGAVVATAHWERRSAPPVAEIRHSAAQLRTIIPDLEAATQRAAELDRLRVDAKKLHLLAASAASDADNLESQAAEAESSVHDATTRMTSDQAAGATAPALAAAIDELASCVAAAAKLTVVNERVAEARIRAGDAEDQAIESTRQLRVLLEARIADIAGSLAASLQPGTPCAVCGSTAHPNPAPQAAGVADHAIRVADEQALFAREQAETLHSALEAVKTERELLLAEAGSAARDLAVATQRLEALRAGLRAAESAARRAQDLAVEVGRRQSFVDSLREKAFARREQAVAATATAASLLDEVERRRASHTDTGVDADIGADGDRNAPAALAAAATLLRCLDDLETAVVAEVETRGRYEEWSLELSRQAIARGFTSVHDALEAIRTADRVDEIRQLVRRHEATAAAARATLDDPDLATLDVDLADEIDVDQLAVRAAALSKASETSIAAHEQLVAACAAVERLASQEDALSAQLQTRQREAAAVRRMADVCSGTGNSMKMSLERYVLAARLEEITGIASQRFRAMSDGRFTLRHSDARAKGGVASGLSILVHDAWTGVERDVRTLSGGETFQASLAYALAVADVVQHHAGGIHIDALFVDEGFGSLHPEALEQAMVELDRLRAGGRLVGIISHVAALHERITTGIEVVKAQSGSHLRIGAA